MPQVSLCMIARDEASMIGPCLASARPLCDELIVVDTGSTDQTVAIAEAAGAKVVRFTWCDDFAAARNASIEAATGDWVLVLDADERLTPESPARIRQVLAQAGESFDAGMLRLHDAARLDATPADVLSGTARLAEPMYLPRLLRRTDDLAYEGVVHESVRAWSARHGHRQRDVEGDIIHLGAVPSHRLARDKGARNRRLLEKRLALEPDDFTVHGYLAHEHLGAGDAEAAWAVIEAGWAIFLRSEASTLRSVLRLTAARALVQMQRGDTDGVLATCDATERYEGPHPDTSFFRARALELKASQEPERRLEHLATAATHYRETIAQADSLVAQRYVRGASTWCGQTRLGTVELMRGRLDEAAAAFAAALSTAPDPAEAELGAAEVAVARQTSSPDALSPDLEADVPDAWLISAIRHEAAGDLDGFTADLARARSTSSRGYLATHRHRLHVAAHLSLLAYRGKPTAGPGSMGAACALMAGGSTHPSRLDPYERPALVRLVGNLLRTDRPAPVERLLTDDAEAGLPGIKALVMEVVASLGMSVEEQP